MAARVDVYTTDWCLYCTRARHLLRARAIAFTELDVTEDDHRRAWLVATTGRRTVPQIFIDGRPIGGAAELYALDRSGELARLLASPPQP